MPHLNYLTRTAVNSSLLQLKTSRLLAPQKHSHKPEEQRLKYLLLWPLNTKQFVFQLNKMNNQVNSVCSNSSLALLVLPSLFVNFISTLQTFREIRAENPFFPHFKKLLCENFSFQLCGLPFLNLLQQSQVLQHTDVAIPILTSIPRHTTSLLLLHNSFLCRPAEHISKFCWKYFSSKTYF